MKWCIFFKNNTAISDIIECDESIMTDGTLTNVTIQMSDNKKVLENTLKMFSHNPSILNSSLINKMKEYRKEGDWLKLHEEYTNIMGKEPCCQGVLEKFVDSLEPNKKLII